MFVEQRGLRVTIVARCLTTQAIDRTVTRGRRDPAAGVGGQAGDRPAFARDHERLLDHLLGDVDIAEETDQGRDDPTGFLSEDPFEIGRVDGGHVPPANIQPVGGSSWNGRTSTGPMHAAEPFAAHTSAASRSGAVMIQKPPSCSLVSANGPSVMTVSP